MDRLTMERSVIGLLGGDTPGPTPGPTPGGGEIFEGKIGVLDGHDVYRLHVKQSMDVQVELFNIDEFITLPDGVESVRLLSVKGNVTDWNYNIKNIGPWSGNAHINVYQSPTGNFMLFTSSYIHGFELFIDVVNNYD